MNANTRDEEDVPLLHWAAINDRRKIVSYLLGQVMYSLGSLLVKVTVHILADHLKA